MNKLLTLTLLVLCTTQVEFTVDEISTYVDYNQDQGVYFFRFFASASFGYEENTPYTMDGSTLPISISNCGGKSNASTQTITLSKDTMDGYSVVNQFASYNNQNIQINGYQEGYAALAQQNQTIFTVMSQTVGRYKGLIVNYFAHDNQITTLTTSALDDFKVEIEFDTNDNQQLLIRSVNINCGARLII